MNLVETSVIATVRERNPPNQTGSDPEAPLNIVPTKQTAPQGLSQPSDHETGASKSMQMAELEPNHDKKIADLVELNKKIIYKFEDELREGHQRLAELERKLEDQKKFIQETLGSHIGRDMGGRDGKRKNSEADTPVEGHKRRRRRSTSSEKRIQQIREEVVAADMKTTEKADLQKRLNNNEAVASRIATVTSGQIPVGPSPTMEAVTNRETMDGYTTNGYANNMIKAVA